LGAKITAPLADIQIFFACREIDCSIVAKKKEIAETAISQVISIGYKSTMSYCCTAGCCVAGCSVAGCSVVAGGVSITLLPL
jgi:hypothetical protein